MRVSVQVLLGDDVLGDMDVTVGCIQRDTLARINLTVLVNNDVILSSPSFWITVRNS